MATFVACQKNELDYTAQNAEVMKQHEVDILSFDTEQDFLNAVQSIRNDEQTSREVKTRSSNINFKSIYDEFDEAMSVADEYYTREGGYEEFKKRFPNLYYPEHGEDYAAFLPVSDESVAKLLNKEGKVIIAGKEKDMRDVFSYEKIQELGLAMPENENVNKDLTTRAFTDMKILDTSDKQKMNAKRKAWVTLRGIKDNEGNVLGRVDLCFRKKGAIHWYNGKMTSTSYYIEGGNRVYYRDGFKELEYSPHKYYVAYKASNDKGQVLGSKTFYFECGHDYPKYSFTGIHTCNLDALLRQNNGTGFGEDFAAFLKKNWFLLPVVGVVLIF